VPVLLVPAPQDGIFGESTMHIHDEAKEFDDTLVPSPDLHKAPPR
jgi:hypothetical protein